MLVQVPYEELPEWFRKMIKQEGKDPQPGKYNYHVFRVDGDDNEREQAHTVSTSDSK